MTEYDLMQAAAGKLTALWPDRPVYTGTIPAGADGSFFLEPTGSEQTEGPEGPGGRGREVLPIYV